MSRAEEVAAIQRQLEDLQGQVQGPAPAAAPAPLPPSAGTTTTAELEEEVTTLYHELQRSAGRLEVEKANRKKVESELEAIRQQRLRETADVVKELEEKRQELNALREERAMMKEWLDRGVSECRRVAEEVVGLKQELESSETTREGLETDTRRLSQAVQTLEEEVAAAQVQLRGVEAERGALHQRVEEGAARLGRAEEERDNAAAECERLSAEIARLSIRVRGLDEGQLSLQSMIASFGELIDEVHEADAAVVSGALDALSKPTPGAGSSDTNHGAGGGVGRAAAAALDIGQPQPLPSLVTESKRKLRALQEGVATLRTSVKRFVSYRQKTQQDQRAAHEAQMAELHRSQEAVAHAHTAEVTQLQKRIADLEHEIVLVADGVARDTQEEAQARIQQLDEYVSRNRNLQETNDALRSENEQLRAKAKKMKLDWAKVDESRRRYQELELEVKMMKEYSERLQRDNRSLKLMLDAGNSSGMGAAPVQRSAVASAEEPPAKDRAGLVSRHAFEEWRQGKLTPSGSFSVGHPPGSASASFRTSGSPLPSRRP